MTITVSEIASGVGESLRGILEDLTSSSSEKPKSLRDIFLEGDRLRGTVMPGALTPDTAYHRCATRANRVDALAHDYRNFLGRLAGHYDHGSNRGFARSILIR